MDGLRLALLIAGVALIGGIYVFGRLSRRNVEGRRERKPRRGTAGEDSDAGTREPRLEPGGADSDTGTREPRRESGGADSEPVSREPRRQPGGADSDTGTWEPRRQPSGADSEPVSREPRRQPGGADSDTGTREPRRESGGADSEPVSREPYRDQDGEIPESVSRESRRGAEGSGPASGELEYGPDGASSGTATREPYRAADGEGSESAAWELYDEAGTEESNTIPRESRREAGASEPASRGPDDGAGGEDPGTIGQEPRRDLEGDARGRHTAFDPRSVDGDYDVGALGGMFTPRRKTPDEELSVDVGVLSGMRASYEGTVDDSVPPAPGEGEGQPSLDASRPIVFLTLVAKRGRLPGHAILDAFDAEGFRPGPMQIYHYQGHSEPGPPVAFGVANLVEPGVLEPDSLPGIETPGLVMFMGVTDDVAGASRTLEAMIAAGRRLAHRLDATLCDETRSTLTAQAENHLHERIVDIARRARSGG